MNLFVSIEQNTNTYSSCNVDRTV